MNETKEHLSIPRPAGYRIPPPVKLYRAKPADYRIPLPVRRAK